MTFIWYEKKLGIHKITPLRRPITMDESEIKQIFENREMDNEHVIFIGNSNSGKTVAADKYIESIRRIERGKVVVIALTNKPGNDYDFGFNCFEPFDESQVKLLKRIGREPKAEKIKLYHPFVFDSEVYLKNSEIRNRKLPEINFYTYSIKDLTEKSWASLLNRNQDDIPIDVSMQTAKELSNHEGYLEFLQRINQKVRRGEIDKLKIGKVEDGFIFDTDSEDKTTLSKIVKPMRKLYTHFFLQSHDFELNLDFEKILNDPEHIHVFGRYWIENEQMRYFDVNNLEIQLMKAIKRAKTKYRVIILKEEMAYWLPKTGQTVQQEILGKLDGDILKTARDAGKGVTLVATTQLYRLTDDNFVSSCPIKFLGGLDPSDQAILFKNFGYDFGSDEMRKISSLVNKRGSFRMWGSIHYRIRINVPQHSFKIKNLPFFEAFSQVYPDKLVTHAEVYDMMKQKRAEISATMKIKMEEEIERIKQEEMQKKLEREAKQGEKSESKNQVRMQLKERIITDKANAKKRCYEDAKRFLADAKKFSWRAFVKAYPEHTDHKKAKRYVTDYAAEVNDDTFNAL